MKINSKSCILKRFGNFGDAVIRKQAEKMTI